MWMVSSRDLNLALLSSKPHTLNHCCLPTHMGPGFCRSLILRPDYNSITLELWFQSVVPGSPTSVLWGDVLNNRPLSSTPEILGQIFRGGMSSNVYFLNKSFKNDGVLSSLHIFTQTDIHDFFFPCQAVISPFPSAWNIHMSSFTCIFFLLFLWSRV